MLQTNLSPIACHILIYNIIILNSDILQKLEYSRPQCAWTISESRHTIMKLHEKKRTNFNRRFNLKFIPSGFGSSIQNLLMDRGGSKNIIALSQLLRDRISYSKWTCKSLASSMQLVLCWLISIRSFWLLFVLTSIFSFNKKINTFSASKSFFFSQLSNCTSFSNFSRTCKISNLKPCPSSFLSLARLLGNASPISHWYQYK